MRQFLHRLSIPTRGRGLLEVTAPIAKWMSEQKVTSGLLTIFCRHTSASLLIQENADPDVRADLEAFFRKLVPEGRAIYRHESEGEDDMPSHIKAALTNTQLSIPVAEGHLALGTWQGIYLFEHRDPPHRRELMLHLLGEG